MKPPKRSPRPGVAPSRLARITALEQEFPAVAADGAGNYVVAWESSSSSGTDTSGTSIQTQRFAANGVPLGGEAQINSYTTSIQELPVVAAADGGDFVVAWTSVGSFGTDSSYSSIQAQRFGCVFCDGFQSGDTATWSAVAP